MSRWRRKFTAPLLYPNALVVREPGRGGYVKQMTCRELGGDCSFRMSAETSDGMTQEMWNHLKEKHPVIKIGIESDGVEEWRDAVNREWDATPRVQLRHTYPDLR